MATQRPTILQIIPNLDTGGAERAVVDITAALTDAGARSVVVTQSGKMIHEVEEAGGTVHMMPAATKNPVTMLANARRLKALYKEETVNLVHARSRAPAWSALWAARAAGLPFVTTYHGAYNQTNAVKGYYNSVMGRGDIVIANSQYTADLIRSRHGTPADRIRVIYRGIDLDGFNREAVSEQRINGLRAAWDIPEEAAVIVQAARLTRWKGQLITIEAFAHLTVQLEERPLVLVLAGDAQGRTDYLEELKTSARSHGVFDTVRLPGHCSDVAAAYALADVAVVASIEPEAFGRTAAESQAAGAPTIATRLGAPQETVLSPPDYPADQTTGWLVEPGNPKALASAMAQALNLPPTARTALVARARENVVTRFSLSQMKTQTLAVYDELLGSSLAS